MQNLGLIGYFEFTVIQAENLRHLKASLGSVKDLLPRSESGRLKSQLAIGR
jgi:hypothetical protein